MNPTLPGQWLGENNGYEQKKDTIKDLGNITAFGNVICDNVMSLEI